MDLLTSYAAVIKSEPEIIPEGESPTSPCDAILQEEIVKQETEDASAIKCEPGILTAEEHGQECGACSEIDIDYPDIKKECFVHLERINQSRDITRTTKETSKPQLPTHRKIPERDLIGSSRQVVRDEAELLMKYDEEIHILRMETAREQREIVRKQKQIAEEELISARMNTRLKEMQLKKAQAELDVALEAIARLKNNVLKK